MTANVFPQDNQVAAEIEDRRGMNATGPGKIALGLAQPFGQFEKCRGLDSKLLGGINRRKLLANEFDARLSTQSATA